MFYSYFALEKKNLGMIELLFKVPTFLFLFCLEKKKTWNVFFFFLKKISLTILLLSKSYK